MSPPEPAAAAVALPSRAAPADHWGLTRALWISALMPLAGFLVALALPEPRRASIPR